MFNAVNGGNLDALFEDDDTAPPLHEHVNGDVVMCAPATLSDEALQDVRARAVEFGGRKSKARKTEGPELDAAIGKHLAASALGSAPPSQRDANMPLLKSLWDLDDWSQRMSDPRAHTYPAETRIQSAAECILETIRVEQAQRLASSASHDASASASAAAAAASVPKTAEEVDAGEVRGPAVMSDAPPSTVNLTIEQFFNGDFTPSLVGHASDMHELLVRARNEMDMRNELAEGVRADVSRTRPLHATAAASVAARIPPPARPDKTNDDDVAVEPASPNSVHVEYTRIEECSKTYCADFFREAREEKYGERPCLRGKNCIFMLIALGYPDTSDESVSEERFVCREFLRPSEVTTWKDTGALPEERRPCLGCNRNLTTMAYHSYHSKGQQCPYLLQDHYNSVDSDGEYDITHCLSPSTEVGMYAGIARPIVAFAPHRFIPVKFDIISESSGKKWLLTGAAESQADFRISPSSYDRPVAERIASTAMRDAAAFRGDRASAAEVASKHATRASDKKHLVDAPLVLVAAREGPLLARPPPAPPAWISGPRGMEVGGVPAALPFRPSEWIAAEQEACAFPRTMRPIKPFTPRLLLGRSFPQYADTVFCPFETTVAAVRANPAPVLMLLRNYLENSESFYSFGTPVLRAAMSSAQRSMTGITAAGEPTYFILLALLYRVHIALTLASTPARRGAGAYMLHLFADTHIDLAIVMRQGDTGYYDDARLEDPLQNPISLSESMLDANMPHDTRCIHAGDLPDVSDCLQYGSVWYQMDGRQYAGTVVDALVYLIVYKTQTHKCKVRNLAQILLEYACDHPQIMTVLRGIIAVSLLGNYPHAKVRPDFEARLHIVYSMRLEVTNDPALFLWVANNEAIIYASLKEFYRYTVSICPAFEVMLLATTYWSTVSRSIGYGMDRVRSVMNLAFLGGSITGLQHPRRDDGGIHGEGVPGRDPLTGGDALLHAACMAAAADELRILHDRVELPMIWKLRKGPFDDAMLTEMTRFYTANVLNDNIARPQSSLTAISDIDGATKAEYLLLAMRGVIADYVPQYYSKKPLPFGWLQCFGVTREGVAALRSLCYDYELKDIADNSVTRRVTAIFAHNKRDFFVMHVFFTLVHDWRATQSFSLPQSYVDNQEGALRAKWKIMPWDPLPDTTHKFWYCTACERWLADIVDPAEPETAEHIYSIGTRHGLYSLDTGYLYCGMQKIPVNMRKQTESGRYANLDTHIPDEREAKRVRNFLQTPTCSELPAVPVNMLGRVQRLKGRMWALCEICASLTEWDATKFGPSGFTCGFHGHNAPRVLTARQEDAAVERTRRRHCEFVNAKCSYCEVQLKPKTDYALVTVVDDVGDAHSKPTGKYLRYILCGMCGPAIRTPNTILLRSAVEKSIKRVREWQIQRDMKYGWVRT